MIAGRFFKYVLISIFCISLITGCGSDGNDSGFEGATFAVLSDLHVFDLSLLINDGAAFSTELAGAGKLLQESEAILKSAVAAIQQQGVQFVLIPGDLTKDGERVSFETVIRYLEALEHSGVAVYVVPGNHDINNPEAAAYDGDAALPVDNVGPEEFEELFHDYGFGEALVRDPDSLSYVAEPVPGLWLLGLDSCNYGYAESEQTEETSGAFSEATLNWIVKQLEEAEQTGKRVIAMMHHGLVEHFTGQSTVPGLGDEFVIDDWENVSGVLAQAGLHVIFTGHYHAQDITKRVWDGTDAWLLDVETGSTVTYPNPYRVITLQTDEVMRIQSAFIDTIDWDTGGLTFQAYSRNLLETQLNVQASLLLATLGLSQEETDALAPFAADAIVAHYAGDETPSPEVLEVIQTYSQDPDLFIAAIGFLLGSLWTDLPPADNNVDIDLQSGEAI